MALFIKALIVADGGHDRTRGQGDHALINRFGNRYLSDKEFLDYAKDLDLLVDHPQPSLLEFVERLGILMPVARIRFPAEIARRWQKESYPTETVPDPIERDTPRLEVASELYAAVFNNRWTNPEIYGEQVHPLDDIAPEHAPFVQTGFNSETFIPWDEFRVAIAVDDGNMVYDGGQNSRTCYHYWQVFPLAAFLRSGINILYDLSDTALFNKLFKLDISETSRNSIYPSMNLEGRHELNNIMQSANLFEAVAFFEAYRQNALRKHSYEADRTTGKLPYRSSQKYRARERALAREVLKRYQLKPEQVLEFVKLQAELWCTAKLRSPEKLAAEYRRNIDSTIDLYQLVTRKKFERITEEVGRAGGYFKPILKVIFPSWLDEQRELAERSLKSWILPSMAGWPAPFALTDQDISDFCDWLEQQGLYQLYWHFKRLLDLGRSDTSIVRSAVATEAVSYANSAELLVNAVLQARSQPPRGKTLAPKVRHILRPHAPQLDLLIHKFKHLTNTDKSTLKRRLAQIDRIRQGGSNAPVLRVLLKLIVIRNEGTHLGLGGLDRQAIYGLLEALVQASLILWVVR